VREVLIYMMSQVFCQRIDHFLASPFHPRVPFNPRVTTVDRLRSIQLEEAVKALKPFAAAADRIEKALGGDALDDRPARSGALLTLGDLRRARIALRQLEDELRRSRERHR
jgi:hypothetical protein